MKEMMMITLSLVMIVIGAAMIIVGTFYVTSPVRYWAEKKEKEEALKKMAPAAEKIAQAGEWTSHRKTYEYHEAKAGKRVIAYIASTAGRGYSSYVQCLVALDRDLRITGVTVLGHKETPGLGDQIIEEEWFLEQFKGKSLDKIVLVKKETEENIQAISGATISSRAVTNGVKDAVAMLAERYGRGVKVAAHGVKK